MLVPRRRLQMARVNWLSRYSLWTSRFTWFGVIVLPAISWYFWLGWRTPEDHEKPVKDDNQEH